jgi:hypothetical protein
MNLFRFAGDMSHILSFILLLQKIVASKSAAGISLRTQEMYMGACHATLPRCAPAVGCGDACYERGLATAELPAVKSTADHLCRRHACQVC